MKVLVIEGDRKAAHHIQKRLTEEGFFVDVARDGDEGAAKALTRVYDCVILDASLPNKDGYQLAAEIRRAGRAVPIVLLTTRAAAEDVVRGLELGVDDYLIKPFAVDVLLARLRGLLRRGGAERLEVLRFRDLEIDRLRHAARRAERRLDLTPTEFRLLEYFLLHPERVISRPEILEAVWNLRLDPGSNLVDVHIGNLRRKLVAAGEEPLIHTVRGLGFILERRDAAIVKSS